MSGLSKKSLMLRSCYLHYIEGLNIQDVAEQLNISRFRISRYLSEARESGLISFNVNDPDIDFEAKAIELEKLFGLNQVVVAPVTPDVDRSEIRHAIGKAGVQVFLGDEGYKSLAISWGRTIAYAVDEIPEQFESPIEHVIEISGSVGTITSSMSAHSVGLVAAERLQAHCIQFPAPIIVDNPDTVQALCNEYIIKRALDMAKICDLVISGVGPVHDRDSSYSKAGFLTAEDLSVLEAKGAVGSLFGRFFSNDGKECETEFRDRVAALSYEDYLQIPNRIVLAGGEHKVESIYALAKNGIITALVTDSITADLLIKKFKTEEMKT